jgi:hypothetical protein
MKHKIKTCKVNIAPIGVLYCRTNIVWILLIFLCLVLVTKSEGEIAGTRPSTTLNINIRRWAVLLFSSVGNCRSMSNLVMQPGSLVL